MKTVFRIFLRDLKRLSRNRAAALVMVGVCLLPSLYAWFNIAANMDPYGNTAGIKVAIANCDRGASSDMISLNAGDTIVQSLKKNDQLGWVFVDEKKAKEGVRSGKYYAAIVIPDDFSNSLLSVLSGEIKDPKLDYYINEKKNAIAPKITDTGATTIQQEINDTFSAVASEAISKLIQKAANQMSADLNSACRSDEHHSKRAKQPGGLSENHRQFQENGSWLQTGAAGCDRFAGRCGFCCKRGI